MFPSKIQTSEFTHNDYHALQGPVPLTVLIRTAFPDNTCTPTTRHSTYTPDAELTLLTLDGDVHERRQVTYT